MKLDIIINEIVSDPKLHLKWLNTLSLMEFTGSKKISRYIQFNNANYSNLKHAAEEARHAFYLKKQLSKIKSDFPDNYDAENLLAPIKSQQYLRLLDVKTLRYLRLKFTFIHEEILNMAAYLLVTFAIEKRAEDIYPIYQNALDEAGSKVNVKSIIAEEEGHLEEMTQQLEKFNEDWEEMAKRILSIENDIFKDWMESVFKEVNTKPGRVSLA